MNEISDEIYSPISTSSTPPLSPTKTISTDGWLSPKTPGSPRKSRSCFVLRNVQEDAESSPTTPSLYPKNAKVTCRFGALPTPEMFHRSHDIAFSGEDAVSQDMNILPTRLGITITPFNARCLSRSGQRVDDTTTSSSQNFFSNSIQTEPASSRFRRDCHDLSDGHSDEIDVEFSATSLLSGIEAPNGDSLCHPHSQHYDLTFVETSLPYKLYRLPLRCTTSPLRPSQWVARGGRLSSSRRHKTSALDRFIALRRPLSVTREKFELNKAIKRREEEYMALPNSRLASDPFDHRLHRSERLNDELRSLREAHSILLARTGRSRRNINSRQASVFLTLRQISSGAVWHVGGPSAVSDTVVGVSTGNGRMLGVGTNAPLYKSAFLNRADPEAELEAYERRLALALDVDQTGRVLQHSPTSLGFGGANLMTTTKTVWRDGEWVRDRLQSLLDAPQLRDDYYCTLLAYSHAAKCLAVGLGDFVHLWSEGSGVHTPECLNPGRSDGSRESQHVTCLDFSSFQGNQSILAVGRADGRITLWSTFEPEPRFDAAQPKSISCVSWRPTLVQRPSLRDRAMNVSTEELLIGDEMGHIYFYSVEWPPDTQTALFGWHGAMTLLARLTVHTQQICGLAWSVDGELFASGSNDNSCNLFETKKVLCRMPDSTSAPASLNIRDGPNGESVYVFSNQGGPVLHQLQTAAKYKWVLNAAVKAIAFCPWQRGLIAIGGGSNDRCIHFYHTRSGTCLATIDCAAQVTALIWSRTRREIAATFGFAQPEHPYRLAVFAWPSCEQIGAVPWWDENRALCAVAYPGGPTAGPNVDEIHYRERARREDGGWPTQAFADGCIVVAASDMAIRFHEIWSNRKGRAGSSRLLGSGMAGLPGDCDLFESLRDTERRGTVIR